MRKKILFIFILILLLATGLRFWHLGSVPISPDWDEVALGYNAWSVMQTGRDEYGDFLPLVLQSFGDYKPALYIYLAMPTIALFGLNVFAIRLPSVILGIFTVAAVYFIVKLLFTPDTASKKSKNTADYLALLSTFLLAISPWHIQFSRTAFEANAGLAFNVFGVLFFLMGLKKRWLLPLSAISFGAGIYVYQSEKVFVPLLVFALLIFYWKKIHALPKRVLVITCLTTLFVCTPFFYSLATDSTYLNRAKGVSIFSQQTELLKQDHVKLLDAQASGDLLGEVLYNRRVTYLREVFAGYLAHYNFNWLFVLGDLPRHHAPDMGLLYLWEAPFLFLGIYLLLFGKFPTRTKLLLFTWFLIAPIPASITNGVPHAVRTINFLPTFQIFVAIGLFTTILFILSLKHRLLQLTLFAVLIGSFLFNFVYYLNQYFVQQNYFSSREWQYGYEEAVADVRKREKDYEKIIVSDQTPLDQSYIFFLFYLQYPPAEYQKEVAAHPDKKAFGKYEFRNIKWDEEKVDEKILYIGQPSDFTSRTNELKSIRFLDGTPAILFIEK